MRRARSSSSGTPRPAFYSPSRPRKHDKMRKSSLALLLFLWVPGAGAMTIERVTSLGGIEAWLVEDHTLPVVSIRFAFPGGGALDPPGKAGLAAMTMSLLEEGAGPYDTAAFKTRLEDLAA